MSKRRSFIDELNQPYYFEARLTRRWIACFRNATFVFLFLLIFQPFGLSQVPEGLIKIVLGFGLITFGVMAVLNVALVPFFPSYFSEERWTVLREIWWNIINVLLIGLANILYSAHMGFAPFTLAAILVFELYTITIAVFPIGIAVFIKENTLKRKFEKLSEEINVAIEDRKTEEKIGKEHSIEIRSENEKEKLLLSLDHLLFIRASDNYIEVYFLDKENPQKRLIRNSLKAVSTELEKQKDLFRCHKSFLVNTRQVKYISGNAQGYKLHLNYTDQLIPVSRQFNLDLKQRLNL